MSYSRRSFLKGLSVSAALASGGCRTFFGGRPAPRVVGRGQKVRIGVVGAGGKGVYDFTQMMAQGAEIVAFCDVDSTMVDAALATFQKLGGDPSKVRRYADWRRMLEREERNLDAITISTPDHMHAAIAVTAMRLGIHCYVQKPLVRTLWEAELFGEVARETGVITQMGNQGSSGSGHRRNVELLQQGVIGDITEIHVWTDRPIWPQGNLARDLLRLPPSAPPPTLDWDGWIGCAPMRPFIGDRPESIKLACENQWAARLRGVYHPFNWRAFYDFGTGAFGDMACHTMNLPFRGAELGAVTKAECKCAIEPTDAAYPARSIVEVTYAPRTSRVRKGHVLPETKVVWYDGDQRPPADLMPLVVTLYSRVPRTGCYIIGTKGVLCSTNDYGQEALIALNGEKRMRSTTKHPACKELPAYLPRRREKGELGQYGEFLDAIKGETPVIDETLSRCYSDVGHSVPMMEGMLVGCIAQRVSGALAWDSANRVFVGSREANALVRPFVRKGWEF